MANMQRVKDAIDKADGSSTMQAFALRQSLPVLREIYDGMSWFRKILFTVQALLSDIESFLDHAYDLYIPDVGVDDIKDELHDDSH